MSKILENLKYTDSHEWVSLDGLVATVGITDYAQHALGNIVYVDFPEVGDEVTAGEEFGAVESVKAASDLISPLSGEVIEINEALTDNPELLNENAFENWIMKVRVNDPGEVNELMGPKEYASLCEE